MRKSASFRAKNAQRAVASVGVCLSLLAGSLVAGETTRHIIRPVPI